MELEAKNATIEEAEANSEAWHHKRQAKAKNISSVWRSAPDPISSSLEVWTSNCYVTILSGLLYQYTWAHLAL